MRPQPFKIRKARGTIHCVAAPMSWSLTVIERDRPPIHRLVKPGGPEESDLFALVGRLRQHRRGRARMAVGRR
jgi:hypothetical protein